MSEEKSRSTIGSPGEIEYHAPPPLCPKWALISVLVLSLTCWALVWGIAVMSGETLEALRWFIPLS
jgi:hypothetical protein